MAIVQMSGKWQQFVEELSALKDATPVTDPSYEDLKKKYTAASDLLESLQEKEIDEAGAEYKEFSAKIKEALEIFEEAEKKIAKISKVVKIAAQVIDIAGKIAAKVC
jgi:predicted  nucleic acid-binding Zn-ribbon protein